jgi:DNA-binding NarL/FixJ family response regulator
LNTETTLLIADDHSLIVQGLQNLLQASFPQAKVVTATDKSMLNTYLQELQPIVLLLDIFIGAENAFDFFDELKESSKRTHIIIISSNEDSSTIAHFLNRGAKGFIGKSEDTSLIPTAVRTVMEGNSFLSPALEKRLEESEISTENNTEIRLTRREKEVLTELLKEKSNKEIAEALFIAEKTVEHHKANLYVKFDVKNASGLVKKAIIHGYY